MLVSRFLYGAKGSRISWSRLVYYGHEEGGVLCRNRALGENEQHLT